MSIHPWHSNRFVRSVTDKTDVRIMSQQLFLSTSPDAQMHDHGKSYYTFFFGEWRSKHLITSHIILLRLCYPLLKHTKDYISDKSSYLGNILIDASVAENKPRHCNDRWICTLLWAQWTNCSVWWQWNPIFRYLLILYISF